MDERTFEAWQQSREVDPFGDSTLAAIETGSEDGEMFSVFKEEDGRGVVEVTWDNFPHMNEREIEYINARELRSRRKVLAQIEFLDKLQKGEVYTDGDGRIRPLNPSPLLRQFEEAASF
jgi:hypothetical protein